MKDVASKKEDARNSACEKFSNAYELSSNSKHKRLWVDTHSDFSGLIAIYKKCLILQTKGCC